LLANTTRSVTSRSTGFDAEPNDPQAQLPDAPSARTATSPQGLSRLLDPRATRRP